MLALSRDDLYRVELDIIAGDEMFYSKVSSYWMRHTRHLQLLGYFTYNQAGKIVFEREKQHI